MLREYLSNIADKFRTYLDTTEPINAQDFAGKVEDVAVRYNQLGFTNGYNLGLEQGKPLGKIELLQDSEYMNAKVSGTAISVNDVNAVEHSVGCYLTSDTITDFSGIEVSRYGKNLIFYQDNGYLSSTNSGVQFIYNSDGTMTVNGTATETVNYISNIYVDLPAGDYILSGCPSGGGNNKYLINYAPHYNDVAIKDTWETGTGLKVNAPNGIDRVYVCLRVYQGMTVENLVFKPQLELGTTATPYEPYIKPTTYQSTADGTVEGVTSISPNMTLLSNNNGVVINANYLRDIDTYIDNLITNVALTGGE